MPKQPLAIFGEVLFDQFPEQAILGGAPFNVAWHLQAFGVAIQLISRVGNDALGKQIKQAMRDWGMSLTGLQTDHNFPTGAVQVTFNNGEPHYTILPEQAYDYINATELTASSSFSLLYHGSLALRNDVSKAALMQLNQHHQGGVFVDVNLRSPWWDAATVKQYLKQADWVKLNRDEFVQLSESGNNLEDRMLRFRKSYGLTGLIVTCDAEGAMAIDNTGQLHQVSPANNLKIIDTVGAGDAFSAVILLGIHLDWPLPLSLERAQSFASAMVSQRGATVSDRTFYTPFKQNWQLPF